MTELCSTFRDQILKEIKFSQIKGRGRSEVDVLGVWYTPGNFTTGGELTSPNC